MKKVEVDPTFNAQCGNMKGTQCFVVRDYMRERHYGSKNVDARIILKQIVNAELL
jgi:hypothetical protein